VCLAWLAGGGPASSYAITLVLFALQLLVVFASATWVTRMVLWR
jgi:hypothetical protein